MKWETRTNPASNDCEGKEWHEYGLCSVISGYTPGNAWIATSPTGEERFPSLQNAKNWCELQMILLSCCGQQKLQSHAQWEAITNLVGEALTNPPTTQE